LALGTIDVISDIGFDEYISTKKTRIPTPTTRYRTLYGVSDSTCFPSEKIILIFYGGSRLDESRSREYRRRDYCGISVKDDDRSSIASLYKGSVYRLFEGIIGSLQSITGNLVSHRHRYSSLIDSYDISTVIATSIMDIFLYVRESLLIDRLMKSLQVCEDRFSCLDIWKTIDRSLLHSVIPESCDSESFCVGLYRATLGILELSHRLHDVSEKVFTPTVIRDIFYILTIECVFIHRIWISRETLCIPIIVENPRWSGRWDKSA
jgi:hypothetical protein